MNGAYVEDISLSCCLVCEFLKMTKSCQALIEILNGL